ncbi:NUP205 [Auxenochlorella protothecoides x Auxenochlorella symbiontica]
MGDVPSLALIWEQTAPNPTSRAEIESCNPRTPFGTVQLDRLPDVEQILLLADEFKIDELEALNLIQRGYEQVGEVSAAAGAGQLVEARSSAIQTLFAVLEALSTGTPPPSWVPAADIDYVRERLDRGQPCQDLAALLLQRLASPAIPAPADGSRLVSLVNSAGQAAERSLAAAQEDLLLCQCLSLTLTLLSSQAEPPAKHLPQLLQLLRGSIDAKERAHAFVPLLLCTLYVLVPCVDDPEGMGAQLRSLRFDKQLDEAVAALPDPTCSSVKIAWAILAAGEKEAKSPGSLRSVSQAAVSHGALAFLRHGVLLSAVVTDGPALLAAGAARLAHGLVCALLGTPEGQGVLTGLTQASLANSQAEFEVGEAGSALVLAQNPGLEPAPARPDDLASLLDLLGATVRAAPELFLDEGLRQEEFTDLMGPYFARTQVLARVPSVFVAYHGVLAALAASPDGARSIFVQLGAEHNNGAVGWRQVFGGLVQVIQRYAPAPQQQGSGGAAPQKQPEEELPPWDSAGLCAQVHLFSAVMSHAPAAETALWLVQLTEELGLGPVWEVLIQCMCSPVPQELKAALNAALAALARLPEVAPAILSSLLPAVVPSARPVGAPPALPHYDIGYQLNEVEARAERYEETLSFTRLANVLWRSLGPVSAQGMDAVSDFIVATVLSSVFQRSYRLEAQKWELAEAGLEHASLVLGRDSPAPVSSGGGGQAQAILRDLAGERGVYRTLWSVLEGGVRTLVDARSAAHGRARERATLAALRFLSAALDARDRDAAGAAADTLLRHGRARLPALLGLAAYPLDARLAAAAVEATGALAALRPALACALLATRARGAGGASVAAEARDAWAAALRAGVGDCTADGGGGDGGDGGDGGAAAPGVAASPSGAASPPSHPLDQAVLDVLLDNVGVPFPGLTALLCGLVDEAGMPAARGAPRAGATALDAVLDLVADAGLAEARPGTYEKALALLHALVGGRGAGRGAALEAALGAAPALAAAARHLTAATAGGGRCAPPAGLAQRAWLLLLLAEALHAADAAVGLHREALKLLLRTLLGDAGSVARGLLESLGSETTAPASALSDAPPKLQHLVQALGLADALSAAPCHAVLEGLAAEVAGDTGVVVVDLFALKSDLLHRFDEAVAAGAGSVEDTRAAFQLILRHAQQHNAWAEEASARAFLAGAWRDAIVVALTHRLDLAAASTEEASPLLSRLLDTSLAAVAQLAGQGAVPAAAALAQAAAAAAAALLECVRGRGADVGGAMPAPLVLQASLEALLRALGAAHAAPRVRTPLWAALSSLLALVTPPEELAVPGPVLQIVMDGDDVAAADVLAEADAVFGAPCESMLRTLRSSRTMLACLVGDAASPDTVQASTALSLLATAVRVDAAGTVADVVHAQGLPQRMLQDLAHLPHAAILEPTNARGVVAEAALNLLLALALSGVDREARAANAERLLEAQLLPSLARCEALATHPETLADSLHARLHGLLAPALRLALAVATSLPQSPAARGALLVFLRARAAVLTRVALDAARDGGRRGVGARELEQAALVVGLAGWVPGLLAEDPALQGAVYRLLYRFLCTDEASDSLAVARLRALRESGDGADEAAALADRILALRCALVQYLHAAAGPGAQPVVRLPVRPGPDGPAGGPTLVLIKDALLQAVTGDIPDALTSAAPADRDGAMSLAEVGSTLGTLGRLHRLTFLVEHLLGVLLFQLRGRAAGNDPGLEQLGRTLEPLLLQLEQMAGDSLAPARRLQDLRLLVRRVKEAAAPPV